MKTADFNSYVPPIWLESAMEAFEPDDTKFRMTCAFLAGVAGGLIVPLLMRGTSIPAWLAIPLLILLPVGMLISALMAWSPTARNWHSEFERAKIKAIGAEIAAMGRLEALEGYVEWLNEASNRGRLSFKQKRDFQFLRSVWVEALSISREIGCEN